MIRLVVVDDHPVFRLGMAGLLSSLDGMRVVGQAADSASARAVVDDTVDVVLMDLAMPEMGGLQATRLIKAQDAAPFIVIASHFDDAEHREHALRAGADAFVSKLSYLHDVMPLLEKLAQAPQQETAHE